MQKNRMNGNGYCVIDMAINGIKKTIGAVMQKGEPMAKCKSCGADIIWIKMQSGKSMPCDPYKRTIIKGKGKEVIVTNNGEIIHGSFADFEHGANAVGYISHFSTCPNANKHRRRTDG